MRSGMHNDSCGWSTILTLALATLFTAGCTRTQAVQAGGSKAADAPTVAVAKAGFADLSHGLVLTAEFKPFQEVDLMAKVAGYVKNINVDVGDRVQQDQLLAVLEVPGTWRTTWLAPRLR